MSAIPDIREQLRDFVDASVIPAEPVLAGDDAAAAGKLGELKTVAKARGLWALGHPLEVGGGGVDLRSFVLLSEVIGRSAYGEWAVGSVTMQDAAMLAAHGSAEQRSRWLMPLVRGDLYSAVALTEPDVAGSDPTLIETTARLEADQWVINGRKWFVTGADHAAFITCFCVTEPDETPRHRAMTMILVPAETDGLRIVRRVPTMGHTAGAHCEVAFEDVRVSKDAMLGERGQAFAIAQERLTAGRLFHAMRWLGQAQRAFELMVERANARYAHGSLLRDKGEIRRYVAESAAEIHASRLLTLDAAEAYAAGEDVRVRIGIVKFWCARMLHNVIDRAIQVHGAAGVSGDLPLEAMYRAARYARIYDGPDELHRDSVARRILDNVERAPWR
jgi:alkylation response protein AidB-like acyl-CoA dehydrogenase